MIAKKVTLNELGAMLTHVVEHMSTKEDLDAVRVELKGDIDAVRIELKGDIAALGEQVTSIEQELKGIRRDLDDLKSKVENIDGYRKEIDHAFDRIAKIEKHLGIETKIATA